MTVTAPARITLSISAVHTIRTHCAAADGGRETGGILLGQLTITKAGTCAQVRHAGDPGPAAVRREDYFLRDLAHAQRLAQEAFTADGSQWIGDWHSHTSAPPIPSATDLSTYHQLLEDEELVFEVFIALIAATGCAGPVLTAWACDRHGARPVPFSIAGTGTSTTRSAATKETGQP